MRAVDPIETTDSNFLDSTIQEPDTTIGEQEFVAIPFDGFDLSGSLDNPTSFTKGLNSNDYFVLNKSTKRIYLYNQYFSPIKNIDASFSTQALQCIGTGNFSGSDTIISLYYGTGAWVRLRNESLSGFITSPDFKSYLDSAGISLNAQGVFGRQDGSNSSLYILNQVTSSQFNVVKVDIFSSPSPGVKFNRVLTTSRGTPRDIQYRDGKYSILFSDASGSSISFYDETFATEISNHPITGSNPDQPYDSFTIAPSTGYRFLKESTAKVYNVDSSYNHGATYKVGDQVIKAAIHKKYQCLIDTTQDPEAGVDEVPPTWLELGATNRWAMFDGANTYQSIYGSDVEIEIRPIGVISSICAFNIENVDSVEITTSVPDTGSSYTETFDTTGKDSLVTYDLPPYENPFVTIKFFGTDIKVGEVVMGQGTELGVLLAGAVSDRIDYSRYTYDEFGELTYVPRPIVNYTTYPIRVAKIDALGVERYLDNLKGKQAVWIGNIGDGQHLVTRGTIERSPMTYDTPSVLEYLIKVRGSI